MESPIPDLAALPATRPACMLWSGGKDSFLSYSMASKALSTTPSDWLFVTFVPPCGSFRCHPLGLLQRQSNALGIEHVFAAVDLHNWTASYCKSFKTLRHRWGVERVFTGDIRFDSETVSDYWLSRMLDDVGIEMTLPLAGMNAGPLFDRIEEYEINAVVTGVADWVDCPGIVGLPIFLELLHSSGLYLNPYHDLTGEFGEYHTSVMSAGDLRFASADDVCAPIRGESVEGLNVARMSPSLLHLSSPRLDLASWTG